MTAELLPDEVAADLYAQLGGTAIPELQLLPAEARARVVWLAPLGGRRHAQLLPMAVCEVCHLLMVAWALYGDGVGRFGHGACIAGDPAAPVPAMACEGCGCTDLRACAGGCSWTAPGWCSTCRPATLSGRW